MKVAKLVVLKSIQMGLCLSFYNVRKLQDKVKTGNLYWCSRLWKCWTL